MSFIVMQTDKKGRKYAYRATSVWDPEKKMPISKREYLGRVDENGEIIPKRGASQEGEKENSKDSASSEEINELRAEFQALSGKVQTIESEITAIKTTINKVANAING